MKKCLGKSHLDFLITNESCSLEEGGSRVCWGPGRAADPFVGQLHPGGAAWGVKVQHVEYVEFTAAIKLGC